MYQQSRKMLIFLVVTFVATRIANGVMAAIKDHYTSGGKLRLKHIDIWLIIRVSEEYVLSGAHLCRYNFQTSLINASWILGAVWEIFVLCLAVWITAKHFRELQRPSAGWIVGDYFAILIKTHVFYFAR
jgi:hypothetical protein